MYPGMAKGARQEGFAEIADWFETLAKAERSHANASKASTPWPTSARAGAVVRRSLAGRQGISGPRDASSHDRP